MTNFERKRRRIKDGRAPQIVFKTLNPGVNEIPLWLFRTAETTISRNKRENNRKNGTQL